MVPSIELLIRAHPAAAWWTVLCIVGLVVLSLRRHKLGPGRSVVIWALGTTTLLALAPPRTGPVDGIARTCDLGPEHILWPWDWFKQDPRMGLVGLMFVVGLGAARRPRWLATAATLPLLLEGVQYVYPTLARACSVPDVLHAWMGLVVGLVVGTVLRQVGRLVQLRGVRVRAVAGFLVLGVAVAAVVAAAGWGGDPAVVDPNTRVGLRGEGVHFPEFDVPGAEDQAWIDAGTLPGTGTPYEDMARTALWDIAILSDHSPEATVVLPAAGAAEEWGYFWPRDGAFLAVALARTGHTDRAEMILASVSELYLDPMYGFDARYLLSGGRIYLDPRRAQVDGCGWILWAIHETGKIAALPPEVDDLRDRCTDQLLRATGGGSHLPAPGQDYWEQTTYDHLLGASAPVAAGLRFAAADYQALGKGQRADLARQAAAGVRSEIERFFGPAYLRAGTHGGLDAATAMLMPPFDPDPLPGVQDAWLAYQQEAARPGGGLAPGSQWKDDGISWTPEVALVAYTAAASGQDEIARHWLEWLDQHRAPWGSLPEKVDSQGRPGGPAPLGWTSALVILTVDELAEPPQG